MPWFAEVVDLENASMKVGEIDMDFGSLFFLTVQSTALWLLFRI